MIEWKEWKSGEPTDTKDFYLVTNGTTVDVCYCEKEKGYGYTWWDREGNLFAGVTHYAEINLPDERQDPDEGYVYCPNCGRVKEDL